MRSGLSPPPGPSSLSWPCPAASRPAEAWTASLGFLLGAPALDDAACGHGPFGHRDLGWREPATGRGWCPHEAKASAGKGPAEMETVTAHNNQRGRFLTATATEVWACSESQQERGTRWCLHILEKTK